jgi:tetratricopeptide (TPR) repeat protein
MKWRLIQSAFLAATLCAAAELRAQQVGDSVIVVVDNAPVVDNNNQVVETLGEGSGIQIEGVKDNWLWIALRIPGWIRKDYVLLPDDAIKHYTEQIRQDPSNAWAFCSRGNAWDYKGERDMALADYNEAIRLDPTQASYFSNRGIAWAEKAEFDKAVADYNEALRLDPNEAFYYVSRSRCWNAKGNYDKAVADCDSAIRLNPKYEDARYCRGWNWYCQGDCDKAIADFDEAFRMDPKDAGALVDRGLAFAEKKDFDKAAADCEQALRLAPKSSGVHSDAGWIRLKMRDYGKAASEFDEALRLRKDDAGCYNQRAWLQATCPDERYRDGQKALDNAKRACVLRNWNYWGDLDTYAAANAESGDFEQAKRWETKAIDLTDSDCDKRDCRARLKLYEEKKPYRDLSTASSAPPNRAELRSAGAYFTRGGAWLGRGDYGHALADLGNAVHLDPQFADGYNGLAWLQATCAEGRYRDGKKAVENARRACDLGHWKTASYLDTLAAAYAEGGAFDQAVRWEQAALYLTKDEGRKQDYRIRLRLYESNKAYRDRPLSLGADSKKSAKVTALLGSKHKPRRN